MAKKLQLVGSIPKKPTYGETKLQLVRSPRISIGWLVAALDFTSALGFQSPPVGIAAAASPARAAAPAAAAYPRSEPSSPVHEAPPVPKAVAPKAVRCPGVDMWSVLRHRWL